MSHLTAAPKRKQIERELIRAAEKFDVAVGILFDHWNDLRPSARDDLIESLRATAGATRQLARSAVPVDAEIDEVLAARIASL